MRAAAVIAGEVRELRMKIGALLARKKDGAYDLDDAGLAEVRGMNEALAPLVDELKAAQEFEQLEKRNREELAALNEVRRLPQGEPEPEQRRAGRGYGDDWESEDQRGGRPGQRKRLGDLFCDSPSYKQGGPVAPGGSGPLFVEREYDLKTLFQTSAGWAPESTRTGYVLPFAVERIRVVDLIPKTTTGMAVVKYVEETTHTNNAAETAEAGTYPESAFAFTEQSSTVRKIATSLPFTDEQFEDEPRARDYLNNRLEYQLRARLDSQIVVGNGTAPNLRGMNNVVGINTQAKGTDPVFDAIFKAMVLIQRLGFTDATGIVMHPTDWQSVRLTRTADGVYIMGNPDSDVMPRLYGLPVVSTTFETQGTASLGDWAGFSELALRRGVEFQVTNSHSTFFVEGKQMIRADFRCALLFYRPKAFATVTGL